MSSGDRLKKRLALSAARNALLQERIQFIPASQLAALSPGTDPEGGQGWKFGSYTVSKAETDRLLREISVGLDEEKMTSLLDACKQECLKAVIRPFGVAKVLFRDRDGGTVDTVHNVRKKIFATDREENRFKGREKFDGAKYRQDAAYKEESAKVSMRLSVPNGIDVTDAYTGKTLAKNEKRDLDHVISAKEMYDDAGIYLAELNPIALANSKSNLKPTNHSVNRSKKDQSAQQFAERLTRQSEIRREKIKALESQPSLTDQQRKQLEKLKKLDAVRIQQMLEIDAAARKERDAKVNKAYYTSAKFFKNVNVTSLSQAGRTGLQQSVGLLMEEFVEAAFDELKDVWENGFKTQVDEGFFAALKVRLIRIAKRLQGRWKDAVRAFKDGMISGFLSNLVTVIINTFMTTTARWVRLIREGFFSLLQALKLLAMPPEGMTLAEAADASLKLLATGLITSGGILLEEVIAKALSLSGPFGDYLSSIAVGLTTGLCTAFVFYMLEKIDIFNLRNNTRSEKIVEKLNGMVAEYFDNALVFAAVFDGPELLHRK